MFDTARMSRFLPSGLLAEPDPFDDLSPEDLHPELNPALRGVPPAGSIPQVRDGMGQWANVVRSPVLAVDRALPVGDALGGLLPDGIRRGSTIGLSGEGARSLAFALMARATQVGSWVAVVGDADLSPAAAVEMGMSVERLIVVFPPSGAWASIVASLVGAVDLVLVASNHRLSASNSRRLAARCRESGSVLLYLSLGSNGLPPSVGPLDLSLSVARASWEGSAGSPAESPDEGVERLARLRTRRVEVVAEGRGMPPGGRRCEFLLPSLEGVLARL